MDHINAILQIVLLIFSAFKYYYFFLICLSLLSAKRIRNSRTKYKIIIKYENKLLSRWWLFLWTIAYTVFRAQLRSDLHAVYCTISNSTHESVSATSILLLLLDLDTLGISVNNKNVNTYINIFTYVHMYMQV